METTIDVTELRRQFIEIHRDLHEDPTTLHRMVDAAQECDDLLSGYVHDALEATSEEFSGLCGELLGGDLSNPEDIARTIALMSKIIPHLAGAIELALVIGVTVGREHKRRGYQA